MSSSWKRWVGVPWQRCYFTIVTVQYTLVQSAVLRSHVVCLFVCPSVSCNVGGLWSHSLDFSEIISPLVSLGCSLSADPNTNGLLQGEHPEILAQIDPPPVDLSVRDIRLQIAAEWLHIVQRSQWRVYRKPPSLFLMVPSLIPYALSFPQMTEMRVPYATKIREWPYQCNGWSDTLHIWV